PESFLGIFRAWGGTQLVPRLVGVETAVKFIVANPMRQNRMLKGPEAFELGFADRLLEPAEFVDESLAFALELAAERTGPRDSPPDMAAEDVLQKARSRLDGQVHGAAPAPYKALDLIEGALQEQVAKGRYDEGKARFLASLVSTSTGYEDSGDCDLVLEAVFEELETKRQVFAELRDHVPAECVLATNTSSLSVAEMGA